MLHDLLFLSIEPFASNRIHQNCASRIYRPRPKRAIGPWSRTLGPIGTATPADYSCKVEETHMPNIFYIIGVVVVVFAILGYLGLR
jgi:hypothetical protein